MVKISPKGLKYLCKTTNTDPFSYTGSGTYWKLHLQKHGFTYKDLTTIILGCYTSNLELKAQGIRASEIFNIVESSQWANLIIEQGDGGLINDQTGNHWKIKDTSNMKGGSSQKGTPKLKNRGKLNYQYTGNFITPWGIWPSLSQAVSEAKKIKSQGFYDVVTDRNTLRRYCKSENDKKLSPEGRRTIKSWRGKTPKEIGFGFIKNDN